MLQMRRRLQPRSFHKNKQILLQLVDQKGIFENLNGWLTWWHIHFLWLKNLFLPPTKKIRGIWKTQICWLKLWLGSSLSIAWTWSTSCEFEHLRVYGAYRRIWRRVIACQGGKCCDLQISPRWRFVRFMGFGFFGSFCRPNPFVLGLRAIWYFV